MTRPALSKEFVRFWARGLVAGVVVGVGALLTTVYYVEFRFRFTNWIASAEFLIPTFVGSLPGIGLYIQLMRHQVVADATEV